MTIPLSHLIAQQKAQIRHIKGATPSLVRRKALTPEQAADKLACAEEILAILRDMEAHTPPVTPADTKRQARAHYAAGRPATDCAINPGTDAWNIYHAEYAMAESEQLCAELNASPIHFQGA